MFTEVSLSHHRVTALSVPSSPGTVRLSSNPWNISRFILQSIQYDKTLGEPHLSIGPARCKKVAATLELSR